MPFIYLDRDRIGDASDEQFSILCEQFNILCEQFNCYIVPQMKVETIVVGSNNPMNFFWLGAHMGFRQLNDIPLSKPFRRITELERCKGRSEEYYLLTPEQQWVEDKKLGILDWDGK